MISWSTNPHKGSCHALLERHYHSPFHIIYKQLLNEYSRAPGNFQCYILFGICCLQTPLPVLSHRQRKTITGQPKPWRKRLLGMGAGCCQKIWSFLTGFLSSSAETLQNWGTWSEQAGITLSGWRWSSVEGKLSHLCTNMKHLGCNNPTLLHWTKYTAHAQAISIFLMANVR